MNVTRLSRLNLKWPPQRLPKQLRPVVPIHQMSVLREQQKCDFEIFAYCSKNYQDAYEFVIKSWTDIPSMKLVTLYTDWDFQPNNEKVIVKPMFSESKDWLTGTGRRLDVIKHYSDENKEKPKNVLFLDIDCFLVRDPSEIFTLSFDMAITRLYTGSSYTNKTATAGLWFCKLTPGYYKFINEWFRVAENFKQHRIGVENHKISYVQYSFTEVAKKITTDYKVLPIDERIYNSEHSDLKKWYALITKHNPKILHYKGRRFRDQKIVKTSLELAGVKI